MLVNRLLPHLILLFLIHTTHAITILTPNTTTPQTFPPHDPIQCTFLATNTPTTHTQWIKARLEPGNVLIYENHIQNETELLTPLRFEFSAPQRAGQYQIVFWERVFLEPSVRTDLRIEGVTTYAVVAFEVGVRGSKAAGEKSWLTVKTKMTGGVTRTGWTNFATPTS
ncbi:hypothetical protein HDU98_005767 [Podochytrium sp. JEL0797]|nr:hypothetical protein HDU98_005767 [Podochytrium sp. JEL0797]